MNDEETSQGRIHSKGREGQTDKNGQWGQGRDNPNVRVVLSLNSESCGCAWGRWLQEGEFGVFSCYIWGHNLDCFGKPLCPPHHHPPHQPLRPHSPRTKTALQETALWHPEGASVPRRSPTSAQQMAVVPGPGGGVCGCRAHQKKLAQCPADTTWQLTGLQNPGWKQHEGKGSQRTQSTHQPLRMLACPLSSGLRPGT